MPKRIIICPSFASSHHIKCHIPNMIEVLNPDVIIYNEGLFPQGPENKGHVDTEEFRKKWLFKVTTKCGFDWLESQNIIHRYIDSCHVQMRSILYNENSADACFIQAISEGYEFEVGDIIFPLEPDAFLYEGDAGIIDEEISKLKPGEGLQVKWVDFLETQYYTEAINIVQPKYRRFVYCFDNMENYKKAMSGFTSQNYPALKKVDSFFIRHYCWFQPDPWKQLRYELIYRSDPNYWKDFDNGLQAIRRNKNTRKITNDPVLDIEPLEIIEKILIRPSRSDEGRYAKFINVPHPKAIMNHPNYVS